MHTKCCTFCSQLRKEWELLFLKEQGEYDDRRRFCVQMIEILMNDHVEDAEEVARGLMCMYAGAENVPSLLSGQDEGQLSCGSPISNYMDVIEK